MVKKQGYVINEKFKTYALLSFLITIFIIFLILTIFFFYKCTIANQKLIRLYNIEDKYIALQANFTSIKSQLYNLTSAYSLLKSEYEQISSNYSTLYSEYKNKTEFHTGTICSNCSVVVPASYYNSLTGHYTDPVYNFSFYSPYDGFIIINFSGNLLFNFYVSQSLPLFINGDFAGYATNQYYATAPIGYPFGDHVELPIFKGVNYITFINDINSAGNLPTNITVTFSAKYIGYST
ncbi:MAG: hypothetical protein ACP5U0_10365 [Caldisphaera sp.]